MWKRLLKKTSDIFFEDVIVEEEIQVKRKTNQRNTRKKNVKMTYAYSKSTKFRFPLIPDYNEEALNTRVKMNHSHVNKLPRKKNTTERNRTYQAPLETERLAHGYRKKKSLKELEDIPAFMRKQAQEASDAVVEAEVVLETKKPQEREPMMYSHPDELDRIFKKKNAIIEPKDEEPIIVKRQLKHINRDIPAYQRRKTKTIESIGQQVEAEDKIEAEVIVEEVKPVQTVKVSQPISTAQTRDFTEPLTTNLVTETSVPGYLLDDPEESTFDDSAWLSDQKYLLEQTLSHFSIDAKVVKVTQGPAVTRLEIQPALGVRVSKIRNLADDIKLNMAAKDIRMEAPIPGKNTIGIEIPNEYPQVVGLQEIIEVDEFEQSASPLTIALGLTIEGEPLITNIEKMPHGLIAGATGSGKSVCINSILLSLLYKTSYEDMKLLLIDPKMVELTPYNGLPHLISPVITDPKAAMMALKWAVDEMEGRYNRLAEARVRNIKGYNDKMMKENKASEKMPYIVIVIDELADLMIVSPQEVEDSICRIAQKARACGIHLLVATQRPSVDVITGLIKANIPTRIAFSVSSQVDSRTIIDTNGAEKLLGKGDMLFVENGSSKSLRLQGPFVSDEEIDRVTNHFRALAKPTYLFEQEQLLLEVQDEEEDELLHEVISFIMEQNQASTSLLQRRFRIGYNRAARLIDTLEFKGIISGQNGSKPRDILITEAQLK